MIISEQFAQNIVNEMKEIINQDLNFMNSDGIIIASTDPNRKGLYHEGAKIVAEKGIDLTIFYDNEYIGTRKGINMPVYFEREIIGVIGITGDKEEVERYGKIIRRMTEILIKDAYIKNLELRKIENQRAVIEDLLFNDKYLKNPKLMNQINLFKVKVTGPKVVIISQELYKGDIDDLVRDDIFQIYYRKIIQDQNNLIMQSRDFNIMIIEFENRDGLVELLNEIANEIKRKYNIKSKFGIGAVVTDIQSLKSSYLKSKIALEATNQRDNQWITFYEDMDIELILNPIPEEMGREFIQKIFNGLSHSEIDEFDALFKSYERNNGSIKKISEDLFMHKNTIQYRLNTWHKLLGYDMRNYNDFVILKIANTLRKLRG